jgi:quercetin dioxygenase-like cupin family protein
MMVDDPLTDIVQRSDEIDTGVFVLARLGSEDDNHVLTRATMVSGLFIPLHRHDDVECLHVMTGSLDVYLGDHNRWFTVGAGESIVVLPGTAHAIRNVTDRPTEALGVMTVKLAAFIRELGTIAAAVGRERSREERMQSLRELADRYGYWLASPAESEEIRDLPSITRDHT